MVDLANAFAASFPKMPSWLLQVHDFEKFYPYFQASGEFLQAFRVSEIIARNRRLKVFNLLSFIALVRIQLLAHVLTKWTSSIFQAANLFQDGLYVLCISKLNVCTHTIIVILD